MNAKELLIKLRKETQETGEFQYELEAQFAISCKREGRPLIEFFMPNEQGRSVLHLAYLLTERNDYQYFYWYLSPHWKMFTASDARITSGKNWVPLEEWDPEADLWVMARSGPTNIQPEDWFKKELSPRT